VIAVVGVKIAAVYVSVAFTVPAVNDIVHKLPRAVSVLTWSDNAPTIRTMSARGARVAVNSLVSMSIFSLV
jgi:hypothetical protein